MGNSKVDCKMQCHGSCPCGFFSKRIFGVSICVWLIAFAILPHSARGISWTARSVAELWNSGVKAVGVENENRRGRALRPGGTRPDFIQRGDDQNGPRNF